MRFPCGGRHNEQCTACKKVSCAWIQFTLLEGQPVICEPCIARALGLGERSYRHKVMEYVEHFRKSSFLTRMCTKLRG